MSNPKTNVWTIAVKPWLLAITGCGVVLGLILLAMGGERHPAAVPVDSPQAQPTQTEWITEWKDPQTPTVTLWTDTTKTFTVTTNLGQVMP